MSNSDKEENEDIGNDYLGSLTETEKYLRSDIEFFKAQIKKNDSNFDKVYEKISDLESEIRELKVRLKSSDITTNKKPTDLPDSAGKTVQKCINTPERAKIFEFLLSREKADYKEIAKYSRMSAQHTNKYLRHVVPNLIGGFERGEYGLIIDPILRGLIREKVEEKLKP